MAAGHGLTRHNVGAVVAIPGIEEVNIGHSVIADAVLFGLERAVRDLRAAIERGLGGARDPRPDAGADARVRSLRYRGVPRARHRADGERGARRGRRDRGDDRGRRPAASAPSGARPAPAPPSLGAVLSIPPPSRRAAEDAQAAKARAFPVRHVPAPGQPATYPLDARVVVVCGAGSNGGDGFVVARHLLARGAEVEVFLAGTSEKVTGESRINHDAYIDLGGVFAELPEGSLLGVLDEALSRADFVVDALFGTGLDRPIRGHRAEVIAAINRAEARCVALDLPSGLDADSGAPLGIAVQADDTVTFGHLKIGLLTPEGARLAGNIHVVDLGVPDRPILAHVGYVAEVIGARTIGSYLTPRETNVHKHEAGDVLVVAGSAGKLGAALLTASASMRAGAGLVTVCTWPDAAAALESRVLEVMTARIDPDRITASLDELLARRRAVAIGPGFGLDERARIAVDHVVLGWDGLKVVDADAITHFTDRAEALAEARGQIILTPHPGEARPPPRPQRPRRRARSLRRGA